MYERDGTKHGRACSASASAPGEVARARAQTINFNTAATGVRGTWYLCHEYRAAGTRRPCRARRARAAADAERDRPPRGAVCVRLRRAARPAPRVVRGPDALSARRPLPRCAAPRAPDRRHKHRARRLRRGHARRARRATRSPARGRLPVGFAAPPLAAARCSGATRARRRSARIATRGASRLRGVGDFDDDERDAADEDDAPDDDELAARALGAFVEGDVLGCVVDAARGAVSLYRNGELSLSLRGGPPRGQAARSCPVAACAHGEAEGAMLAFNFGERPFRHAMVAADGDAPARPPVAPLLVAACARRRRRRRPTTATTARPARGPLTRC